MNSKLFFNEIRKIIREEVQLAVKQILTESKKQPNMQPLMKSSSIQKPVPKQNNVIEEEVYSGDGSLQSLLNETAKSMRREGETLHFTSEDAKSFGYGDMIGGRGKASVPPTVVDINGRQIPTERLDSTVVRALTKDYSQVMKKMEEIKKKKAGNG